MDKERRKSIIIYIIILILFGLFSIYMVTRNKDTNVSKDIKPKENITTESQSFNENNSETSNDEIGSEYEDDCRNVVKEFLQSYHSISDIDPLKNFEKAESIVVEQLYVELENEVVCSSSMPTNGFIYRTIEDIKLYDYTFDDESKNISLKAKVYSNWLDKDKSIASKNELTEYDFLLINDMGKWKIAQISSNVI